MNNIKENVNIVFTKTEFWIMIASMAIVALLIGYDASASIAKYFMHLECD